MENTLFGDTLLVTTRGPMETVENRCLSDFTLITSDKILDILARKSISFLI